VNMNQDQNQVPSGPMQFKTFLSWVVFIAGALAASLEVFLHRRFGERYLGLQAAVVLLIVPFYSLFWEGYDPTPLLQFLLAYVVMCALARIGIMARLRRGGAQEHSRYNGFPRLMAITRRISERTIKCVVEPMLVFFVGVFTMPTSEPLGGYLMLAALGLLISTQLTAGYERIRALDMYDAYVNQNQVAQDFRDMRGERW
jgi:hypothetical protein